ncbi:segregation and condensation protein A [Verrucomicrobiota bacterium]|nr:segregation and condensation protein A [Verrucomicrobiota bacterium]
MSEYKVQFEVFEGPLDLLLYLVKKEEVDIYDINLTKIATEFIRHIEMMRQLDLDVAGEFLVMAATLMYIKSRELLPVEQQVEATDEDEDTEDPRWELIRRLVEYKKFKDVAARLQERELQQENTYARQPGKPQIVEAPVARPVVSIFDLVNAVNAILKRFQQQEVRDIFQDKWTVSEKIELLLRTLSERTTIKFSELFASATSRTEVVVTFLAMLELIRLKQLLITQPEPFDEIQLVRAPSAVTPPPVEEMAAEPAAAPSVDSSAPTAEAAVTAAPAVPSAAETLPAT